MTGAGDDVLVSAQRETLQDGVRALAMHAMHIQGGHLSILPCEV